MTIVKMCPRKLQSGEFVLKLFSFLFFIYLNSPHRFAAHYDFIRHEEILANYVEHVTRNISEQIFTYPCNYDDIVDENRYVFTRQYREEILHPEQIWTGGEYRPEECRAGYSSAIIIPYRQREEQLHSFLLYIHNFLRLQRVHYRILLIEQYDQKPFNRAKLLNIGSIIAKEYGFQCFIFTDVDLLPMNLANLYACTIKPRHMSSSIDQWRYQLPYKGLFGGVVSILEHHFMAINGLSNLYEGWGGEDDDFYSRLKEKNLHIVRFPPDVSTYAMLQHEPQPRNENRYRLLQKGNERYSTDGLNSLQFVEKERKMHSLFTHILVET